MHTVEFTGLHLEHLWVRQGGHDVLRDVCLEVAVGTCLALLGPSGCGKSTLLRAIAGLQAIAKGRVHFGGMELTHLPPQRRSTGMLFQHYALFPHRSVRDNIAYGLQAQGWSTQATTERVHELLELVEMQHLSQRQPHQLSGGQQQRVALARALAPRPRLLLMDEPFSALDEHLRGQLRQEVRDILRRTGQTALLVTHDRSEALEMADSVAIMGHGQVLHQGPPESVFEALAVPELRSFVGGFNTYGDAAEERHLPIRSLLLWHEVPEDRRAGGKRLEALLERVVAHPLGWWLHLRSPQSPRALMCLSRWSPPPVGSTVDLWQAHSAPGRTMEGSSPP